MAKLRSPLPPVNVDAGLLVLRVALATILLFHGVYKLEHGIEWMREPLARFHLPLAAGYGAYVAELIAPLFLVAGAWTRLAALVVAFDMVMAMVTVLGPAILTVKAGGAWGVEVEAMIFFSALVLVVAGGGRFSAVRE